MHHTRIECDETHIGNCDLYFRHDNVSNPFRELFQRSVYLTIDKQNDSWSGQVTEDSTGIRKPNLIEGLTGKVNANGIMKSAGKIVQLLQQFSCKPSK